MDPKNRTRHKWTLRNLKAHHEGVYQNVLDNAKQIPTAVFFFSTTLPSDNFRGFFLKWL